MAIPSNRARHRPAYDTSIDSGAHAKAIRDWADDGSYDTRLEWDKNIRPTYVTDALGHETAVTTISPAYLVRRASGRARNGLFRDDAKNVVRHIHADGSGEHNRYDDHGNLLTHTHANGARSTLSMAYRQCQAYEVASAP
jgi:YD repeat-containing protein